MLNNSFHILNRRHFIKSGIAASVIVSSGYAYSSNTKSDKLRLALIGGGRQGRLLLHGFLGQDIIVKGVCDCDAARREHCAKVIDDYYLSRGVSVPKAIRWSDFRDVISDPNVDIVCIATPDHWHAYITIEAMKAGKDVYCEKPLTYSIEESKLVMAAEAKYGRILQTGLAQRSSVEARTACEIVRNGCIGKVNFVDVNFGGPSRPHRDWENPADYEKEGAPNPDVDFDRWCGGAPLVKYSDRLAPRGIHNFFPEFWRYDDYFSMGMCSDSGGNNLDIAQWGLGLDSSGPVKIISSTLPIPNNPIFGGRRQSGMKMVFADGCILEHNMQLDEMNGWGTIFYGTEGIVAVNNGRFAVWRGNGIQPDEKVRRQLADGTFDAMKCVGFWSPITSSGKNIIPNCSSRSSLDACNKAIKEFRLRKAKVKLYRSLNHVANFIKCCMDRKLPCVPASVGGRSSILSSLCNISYVHNAGFDWDPAKNTFANGTGNEAWLKRESYRNNWKPTI
jgi:predicted dehydrogenase